MTPWVIGRFSSLILTKKDDELYLVPLLKSMIKRMSDPVLKVQYDAISGMATFIECAETRIDKYLWFMMEPIMKYFKTAVENIIINNEENKDIDEKKDKRLADPIIYISDCLSSIADSVTATEFLPFYNDIFPLLFLLFEETDFATVSYMTAFFDALSSVIKVFKKKTFKDYGQQLWMKTWNLAEELKNDVFFFLFCFFFFIF